MKWVILLLLTIGFCDFTNGQPTFRLFEQEIIDGNPASVYTMESATLTNSLNVIAVGKIETETSFYIKFYKFDNQLKINKEQQFKLENNWVISDIALTAKGNVWVIGTEINTENGGLIHVYDSSFVLLSKLVYPQNVQEFEDVLVKDSFVYIAGQFRNDNGNVHYNLRKFHEDGHEIWSKLYGGKYFEITTGDAMDWTLDGNIYFTGVSKNKGYYDRYLNVLIPNPYTITLDTAGNILSEHVGGSTADSFLYEYIYDIHTTFDGGFILAGSETLSSRSYLEKVSVSGETEWVRDFVEDVSDHPGLRSGQDGINAIYQLPDSSYLGFGHGGLNWRRKIDTVNEIRMALYHFSPEGRLLNLVDYREFENYLTDVIGYSHYNGVRLNELVPLEKGKGFALAGEVFLYGDELPKPNTYQSQGVIFLLDSSGCLTPGCLLPKKIDTPRFITPNLDMFGGDSVSVELESSNIGESYVDNWGFQLWVNGEYKGYKIQPGHEPNVMPGESFSEVIPNYYFKRNPNKADTLVATVCLTEDYKNPETYSTTLIIPALNSTTVPEYNVPVENMRLYPNPSHTASTLSISNDWPKGEINVVDVQGKIRQSYATPQTTGGALEINAGELPFGSYFIWLNTPQGDYLLKRLVVN